MAQSHQASPLVPTAGQGSDEDLSHGNTPALPAVKTLRRRKFLKCCGCLTASMSLLAVIIVILRFTVFKEKDAVVTIDSVKLVSIELINNNTTPKPGTNVSVIINVSVKNNNAMSFRYGNSTTTLYHRGTVVGEARAPPGRTKAHRTVKVNATVDIIVDNMMSSPNISSDMRSGNLIVNTYTRLPAKMTILNVFKKHVIAKVRCTSTVNVTAQTFQVEKCKWKA